MRVIFLSIVITLAAVPHPCDQNVSASALHQSAEIGWDPETCWDCDQLNPLRVVALGAIFGIPLGVFGILRRRYNNLDATRRIFCVKAQC